MAKTLKAMRQRYRQDNRAVSPVIGMILLLGITVTIGVTLTVMTDKVSQYQEEKTPPAIVWQILPQTTNYQISTLQQPKTIPEDTIQISIQPAGQNTKFILCTGTNETLEIAEIITAQTQTDTGATCNLGNNTINGGTPLQNNEVYHIVVTYKKDEIQATYYDNKLRLI